MTDLDLHDPATANAVADAIVRFKGGGYVPLSERYPWEFPKPPQGIDRGICDPLRPVEGVVLNSDEVATVRAVLRDHAMNARERALAARLEGA